MKLRKAVIPAAGRGTRFLPATKAMPKEMVPIVDKPVIQYIVEEIVNSGIEDILVITGATKRAIEDHFDKSFELNHLLKAKEDTTMVETLEKIEKLADIHYVRQKEFLGTGHAVLKARNHIGDEPFIVLYGDDLVVSHIPCTRQLLNIYNKYNASILAVQQVPIENIASYGVIEGKNIGDVYLVGGLVEKPAPQEAPSNLAALGRYVLEPEIFNILENTPPAPNGEIQLTDAIDTLIKSKAVYAHEIQGTWYSVGDRLSYLKTIVEFSLQREDIGPEFEKYLTELSVRRDWVPSAVPVK